MKPIDPLQLQRLVDGELDQPQIQKVLAEATAAPEQWQEIAVGFVENQIWDRAFQSDHSANSKPADATVIASGHGLAETLQTGKTSYASDHLIPRRTNFSRLVMAASLFLAATIGYMVNQIQNRNVPSSDLAKVASTPALDHPIGKDRPNARSTESQIMPASLEPDCHLEVPQDNEYLRDMIAAGPVAPVPLYRIDSAEQWKQFKEQRPPATIPPEFVQRLNGSGYQMQQDINFISGRLSDGRSFLVPVRTIRFLPGQ